MDASCAVLNMQDAVLIRAERDAANNAAADLNTGDLFSLYPVSFSPLGKDFREIIFFHPGHHLFDLLNNCGQESTPRKNSARGSKKRGCSLGKRAGKGFLRCGDVQAYPKDHHGWSSRCHRVCFCENTAAFAVFQENIVGPFQTRRKPGLSLYRLTDSQACAKGDFRQISRKKLWTEDDRKVESGASWRLPCLSQPPPALALCLRNNKRACDSSLPSLFHCQGVGGIDGFNGDHISLFQPTRADHLFPLFIHVHLRSPGYIMPSSIVCTRC